MVYFTRALALSALLAMTNAQIILMNAKGDSGTSGPLQLKNNDPKDAQIINDEEIKANIVNQCGRTLLNGNIDIGQNTEDAIAAGQVTKVKSGGKVEATFKVQGNSNPQIKCDMDLTSNGNGVSGQTPLTVKQANAGQGQVKLTIDLPADMKLIGGSTGDIGTIRCRNAQNFGSCFPIQQTDTTPNVNKPDDIAAANTLEGVLNLVAGNVKAFKDVSAASAAATSESQQGTAVVDALLKLNPQVVQNQKQAQTANAVGAGKANGKANGKNNGKANGKNNGKANGKANGKNNGKANRAAKANGKNNAKANRNNAKANRNNRRELAKRELQLNRRATAMVALKWAREVLSEEIDA